MNTHKQIEPLLAYYRDLVHEERDVVDQHVAHCAACARQLAAYRHMDQALLQLMEQEQSKITVETDREQRVAFYAALDKENSVAHHALLRQFLAFGQQGARVLLLFLLVVGVVWVLRGQALKNFSVQTAEQPKATETSLVLTPIPAPQHVMSATFGSPPLLELKGYDVEWEDLAEGKQKVHLTYHWQMIGTPTSSYTIFTHLLDAEGQSHAQHDELINMDSLITKQQGEVFTVQFPLEVWQEGLNTLVVGIYDSTRGERLLTQQDGQIHANRQVIIELP